MDGGQGSGGQGSSNSRRGRGAAATAIVLGVILAFVAGAGLAWWWQSRAIEDVEDRLAYAEAQIESLVAETAAPGEPAATPEPSATPTPSVAGEEPSPAEPVVETQPAVVVGASDGGTTRLTVDYVLFLTGPEASDAAAAHGDEVPPPNDYYIVNDNPLLREFPIEPGITVRPVMHTDGTVTPEGYDMPLDDWLAALAGPSGDMMRSSVYWLTITDGVITALEQQFVP